MSIFVAGTGRCGTTRLAGVLGSHPDVYALPDESRFLVDPGGLEDLVDDLTTRYTTFHAAEAVERFDRLARAVLRCEGDYSGRQPDSLGEAPLDRFLDRIVAFRFEESGPRAGRKVVVGRYFEERSDLVTLARELVEEMFGGARDVAERSVWCEKTPYNLLSMPFLWELFPEAAIVHIKRDPRGVANSMARMWWAPDDIAGVIAWLTDTYRRWLDLRDRIDFTGRRYVEVRVEDLAADPASRAALLEGLGLRDAPLEDWFDDRVNWWNRPNGMPAEWRARVEDELGWAIEAMGYDGDMRSPGPTGCAG